MFYLECILEHSGGIKMLFASKRKAENARRKIAKEMAKSRFRNDNDVIEIKSDASTYSIATSRVISISVNDADAWMRETARATENGVTLGVFHRRDKEKTDD